MKKFELYKKQLEGKLRCKVFNETITDENGTTIPIKVAVLLEYFLASQGDTIEDAENNMNGFLIRNPSPMGWVRIGYLKIP